MFEKEIISKQFFFHCANSKKYLKCVYYNSTDKNLCEYFIESTTA